MLRHLTALVSALVLAVACSQLPDSAAPSGGLVDPSSVDLSDSIAYRALSRDDFRGTQVPQAFAKVADRVGAATCGHVLTTPATQVLIVGQRQPDGEEHFRVSVKTLGFRALMDRNCSWWNDKVAAFAPEYVLERSRFTSRCTSSAHGV